jgi:hypothetical protein
MNKTSQRAEVWLLLIVFLLSRLIVLAAGIQMDYMALFRNWQYLDVTTLRTNLLAGLWYDHTQPPIFNLFLGLVVKTFGSGASLAFILLFKAFTLLNSFLLLAILRKITGHPWLPLIITLFYLLSPATFIFENELFYTSFITFLLLTAAWFLVRLGPPILAHQPDHAGVTWGKAAGFFLPLILVCLTRSMYHIVWLLILSGIVWFANREKRNANILLWSAFISLLMVGSWYVKNAILFHSFSTSTWMGMNMARNVFHDAPVADSSRIASIEPFSRISAYHNFVPANYGTEYSGLEDRDLMEEFKNDSFINEKNIAYIAVSRRYTEECKQAIKTHPFSYARNVAQSAIIYFAPATRYPTTEYLSEKMKWYDVLYSFNLSHFAHGKQQRRIALTISAIPKFFIYLFVFFWLVRETIRRRQVPGGLLTIFITLVIGYIFSISSLFEHYENMRFRYEAEPLFLLLSGIVLSGLLTRRKGLRV